MRFGGNVLQYKDPSDWLRQVKEQGYTAIVCPVDYTADESLKTDFKKIILENYLLVGEVGAWGNPMSTDEAKRRAAIAYCQNQLALADEFGANCCVNVSGARTDTDDWSGCYAENFTADTYALIVDTVREIIDAVHPINTFYTLEPMPWMFPDTPEIYLQLIKDIDRSHFGVHLDYTNMINDPQKYANSSAYIRYMFAKLGKHIRSIHAKDVQMSGDIPCSIIECMPGKGSIDFNTVLRCAARLGKDIPVFVEHLDTMEEIKQALDHLKGIVARENIAMDYIPEEV